MTKRAIQLIRVSTAAQAADDRASIPAQKTANQRTAQAYGLSIVRTIQISDVSGAAVLKAPEIQELLKFMEDPEIHGVVAREFSRLMRPENFNDYAMLQAFVDTQTVLYLPEGPIDFSNKSGRLLGTMRAAMSGMELSDMRERGWASKEDKRRRGEFPQSKVCLPFGVDYNKGEWSYTAQSEKVREAFRMMLSGEDSYWEIGRQINVAPETVRSFMKNPIYCGWRVLTEKRDTRASARKVKAGGKQGDRLKVKRAPDEIIRVKVFNEPLITESQFQQAQQIMNGKREHWRRKQPKQCRFVYNGFLVCHECDYLIYTKYRRKDYYACSGRYPHKVCQTPYMDKAILESKLDCLFADRLTDKGFLREVTQELSRLAKNKSSAGKVERLARELESLKAKRSKVLDAYFEGVIDCPERDSRIAKIDGDMEAHRNMIARERPVVDVSFSMLRDAFAVCSDWRFLKRNDKRKLLNTIVQDMRVSNYVVHGLNLSVRVGDERVHADTDTFVTPPKLYIPLPINAA